MCARKEVSFAGNESFLQVSYNQLSVGGILFMHVWGGGSLRLGTEVGVPFSFLQPKKKLLRSLGQSARLEDYTTNV